MSGLLPGSSGAAGYPSAISRMSHASSDRTVRTPKPPPKSSMRIAIPSSRSTVRARSSASLIATRYVAMSPRPVPRCMWIAQGSRLGWRATRAKASNAAPLAMPCPNWPDHPTEPTTRTPTACRLPASDAMRARRSISAALSTFTRPTPCATASCRPSSDLAGPL